MSPAPRRLHRAGILLNSLRALREAALPLLIAFVTGFGTDGRSPESALGFAILGVGLASMIGYGRWRTTLWWVSEGAVHLRSGLLSADETVVPKRRIQSVDTTQGPIQRLFGVLELQLQTAGGNAAEIRLDALTPEEARELRAEVGLSEPAEREVDDYRLGMGSLLLGAVTSPQIGVLLPLVAGAAAFGDDLVGEGLREGWFDARPGATAIVSAALVVLLIAWGLSVLASVVVFNDFRVEREGDRLLIRRGLGQRRAASLPLSRIHAVRVVEGLLRQPFGLASVQLEVAGYRGEASAAQTLFPLVRAGEVDGLLARFVPELAGALGDLETPPPRALRRYLLPGAFAGLVAGAALAVSLSGAWPLAPLMVAVGAGHGLLRYRAAGWRLADGRVILRSRVLARQTMVTAGRRLQEHSLEQSLLQRRARLGNVGLAVGSGRRAGVAHLDFDVASSMFAELRAGTRQVRIARRRPRPVAQEAFLPPVPPRFGHPASGGASAPS